MADKGLMVDTSILIDFFRKKDKQKSKLVQYFLQYPAIYVSSITEFEMYNGATAAHKNFLEHLFSKLVVLDFDRKTARQAAEIVAKLKTKRKTIDKPDLFIAATAIVNNLIFDTLNTRHFMDIDKLQLLGERTGN